ncbi:outer membrane beta-barrel protein [Helicobacter pylori]|uniref:outer membrane protein n=1 Tax=Helicobacter pylori TaxID=210 RepID=UPI001E2B7D4B|nr:outer membrane beta-barrel protein [Helicobacter pylori]UFG20267.1 outer membrane beta-barrel protein [Helicobacter pylori]
MKKSFKKLGFVSLAASSVLLGSMNATDLETYAALQKPSHVFGNYAEKEKGKEKEKEDIKGGKGGSSGNQASQQQQAQSTASSEPTPSTPPTKEEPKKTASSEPTPSTPPTKEEPKKTASSEPTPSTPPTKEEPKKTASSEPTPSTPPTKTEPSSTGNSVASQLVKDAAKVNNLKSVSVSGMNTTLSGVETMSQQSATISALLSGNPSLGSVIPNAQGLNSAFSALESAQNTLKGYLDSSSATIGQLTNGSNAVVGALDKAINQVDMALSDLATADTQKTQAVTLAATGSSTSSASNTTTDAINFLNALKSNLMAQKDAFMNVHKNIQTAVAQAQATYTPSVINTNNYGQMYGVDAMAGYKWFFGKTKRFGFRTYGYYSYNHANLSFVGSQLGIMEGASQVNNFTYGVGFDALYNFYESKEGYNTAGLFVGFGLGGDSFIVQGESYLKSQMHICNNTAGCSASMNTSYFQMPVEFGFRSNFSKHSGIEVGFKLPLFTNQFYKERGVDGSVDVFYKRNFSIYFNYMINF